MDVKSLRTRYYNKVSFPGYRGLPSQDEIYEQEINHGLSVKSTRFHSGDLHLGRHRFPLGGLWLTTIAKKVYNPLTYLLQSSPKTTQRQLPIDGLSVRGGEVEEFNAMITDEVEVVVYAEDHGITRGKTEGPE